MWTFSFCSNARSFDRPTVAKPGEKIKVPIFIRRKGADAFRPALAAGGSLMAYKCLSLCRFRGFTAGFCKNFVQRFQKFKVRFQGKAKNFDLFRMRKKFRVQVERNFPTLSHERFSIVEPIVQLATHSVAILRAFQNLLSVFGSHQDSVCRQRLSILLRVVASHYGTLPA